MLQLQPKAKTRRNIPVPMDLREAMKEVLLLIKEARRDPDVNIDFDDAIQVGSVCGGRYQRKPSRFDFTYYPEDNRKNGPWFLDLHALDIEDIAEGRLTEIGLYCCESPDCGAKFSKADGHCDCDFEEDPDFNTFEFPEAEEKLLQRGVKGIGKSTRREDVVTLLGSPDKFGGDCTDSVLGYIWPWIKYHRDDCQLRFEFDRNGLIRKLTILKPDWEPGK